MLEDEIIPKINGRLPFFSRFVDDCITACQENKTNELKDAFKSYNRDIQFTMEVEENQKISFLDLRLIRQQDGFIKTDCYHKSTWSGRYLNYYSSLPFNYKRNTISVLADKVLKLSDPEFHAANFQLIRETLTKNGYPEKLIKTTIEQTKNKNFKLRDTSETKPRFVSVPYVKGVFEKIKPIFKRHEIAVVGKGNNDLKKYLFSKIKDKVPIKSQSNVIYLIECSCGQVYIGQTKRLLETRFSDHLYHTRTKNDTHSALCDHSEKTTDDDYEM